MKVDASGVVESQCILALFNKAVRFFSLYRHLLVGYKKWGIAIIKQT